MDLPRLPLTFQFRNACAEPGKQEEASQPDVVQQGERDGEQRDAS